MGNKDRNRLSASRRGYDRKWRKLRLKKLMHDPLCSDHLKMGRTVPAAEVDHIRPIAEAPELRLEWTNLRSLCHTCHSRRTARATFPEADRPTGVDTEGMPTDERHHWNA